MAGDTPRQHHYVPEAYLAGFTIDGQRDTQLWVTDLSEKRQFETTPKKTGKERDFYSVDRRDGGDPHVIEKWLGDHIDAKGPNVLRDTAASGTLPTGTDYEWLMLFLAGMILRGKFFRKRMDNFTDHIMKRMLWYVGHDDEAFRSFVASIPEEQRNNAGFSEEALRDFIRSRRYNISFEQTFHIQMMMEVLPKLASVLAARNWHVMRSVETDAYFVCSDHPVSLLHKIQLPTPFGPGYGMAQTLVFFPVSRNCAVVGSFENESHPTECHRKQIAWVNGYTAYHAVRYVYAATKEIIWLNTKEEVCGTAEFLALNRMNLTEPLEDI